MNGLMTGLRTITARIRGWTAGSAKTGRRSAPDARTAICLIHTFDPRGTKMGGLETYCRDMIAFCPPDVRLLVVGIDSFGDLVPGRLARIEVDGRAVDFLPVVAWPDARANGAARRLGRSLTLHFGLGLLRHGPDLRRRLRAGSYTVDNRRIELAPLCRLLGAPFVQMMHDEGLKTSRDALINRFLWIYRMAEQIGLRSAERFFCVNPLMAERMRERFPAHRRKIGTVTTWYNPEVLHPTPFASGPMLRVFYAGRLDRVKNPALMFRAVAALQRRLGAVEFHYVGGWDPERYPEFAPIRAITICHGYRTMREQARLLPGFDVGLLTSTMEGLPRCVLESLGAGRPVAAVHLPQLEPLLRSGVSGGLVDRHEDEGRTAEALADLVLDLWRDMQAGALTPDAIASVVADYTPQRRLTTVFDAHRAIRAEMNARSAGRPAPWPVPRRLPRPARPYWLARWTLP